ncbi:hypothetical protein [Thiomicrorhabdus sp. Milos-T2]|uniref:hypothetical protein n=1 Tax=Thiomicrorhabdus sp. Milos-T2 TaxID=90814 RepID=UPI0004945CA3|nr:hypothetical protein [Thiomicrorhabdus sp. Milos-T2]
MVSQTNEQALEVAIERALTGTCVEEHKAGSSGVEETPANYVTHNGFKVGLPSDFNLINSLRS